LLEIKGVDHITWVYLDHGTSENLTMDEGKLSVTNFHRMFPVEAIRGKSVLVVLDSCRSGGYAEEVLNTSGCASTIHLLTSSPRDCTRSLVILSEVEGLIENGDRDGVEIRYKIQTSMMIRRLMQLLAYESCNPPLSEIPGILHGAYPHSSGFEAGWWHKGEGGKATLREFFPGPFRAGSQVPVKDGPVSPERCLPPMPSIGPLFDDFSDGADAVKVWGIMDLDRPVVEVLGYCRLPDGPVLRDLKPATRGSMDDTARPRAAVRAIVEKALQDPRVCVHTPVPTKLSRENLGRVYDCVIGFVDIWETEISELVRLVPLWQYLRDDEWREVLGDAQEKAEEQIRIASETI
jgi:hypothetical protein